MTQGSALRPIIFGQGASAPGDQTTEVRRPAVALGVAPDGLLLGYVLIDHARPGSLGGLTATPGLSFDTAQALMTSAAMQLALFGVRRPGHHCVLLVEPDMATDEVRSHIERFLGALQQLIDSGYCVIAYKRVGGTMEPELAQRGLAASAAGATIAALEHVGIPLAGATLALQQTDDASLSVAALLAEHGVVQIAEGDRAARAGADVLIAAGPLWRLDPRRARTVRTRVGVMLGPLYGPSEAERHLADRTLVVMPDTIAAAGSLVAGHLVSEGLDEDAAVARCESLGRAVAADALSRAAGAYLPGFVRSLARGLLSETLADSPAPMASGPV